MLVRSLHNRHGLTLEKVGLLGELIVLFVESVEFSIKLVKFLMELFVVSLTVLMFAGDGLHSGSAEEKSHDELHILIKS